MPATLNGRRLITTVEPGCSPNIVASLSPIIAVRGPNARRPCSTTSRWTKKPRGSAPKTTAAGFCLTPSITSRSGVAARMSERFSSLPAIEVGRIDAVGSDTPLWKIPASAKPRWISSPAVFLRPEPTDKRATIVPTPSAIPTAVASVRAFRRSMLVPTSASTAGTLTSRPVRRSVGVALALAVVIFASLAMASPAPDGTAFVVPTTAAAGSHLHIDAKGQDGGMTPKEIPDALGIAFGPGFTLDPSAVPGTCTADQAKNYACPADSVLANGSWSGVVQGLGFGENGQPFNAALTFYKAPPQQSGDPAGVVFTYKETSYNFKGEGLGRLENTSDAAYPVAIRFDKLPLPDLPPGLTITLQELKLDIGAGSATPAHSPKVTRKRLPYCGKDRHHHCRPLPYCSKHRHHRCRHRRRSATAADAGSFITNPAACAGSWSVQ